MQFQQAVFWGVWSWTLAVSEVFLFPGFCSSIATHFSFWLAEGRTGRWVGFLDLKECSVCRLKTTLKTWGWNFWGEGEARVEKNFLCPWTQSGGCRCLDTREINLAGGISIRQKADRIVASFGKILIWVSTLLFFLFPVYFAGHTPGFMRAIRFQGLSLIFPGHWRVGSIPAAWHYFDPVGCGICERNVAIDVA